MKTEGLFISLIVYLWGQLYRSIVTGTKNSFDNGSFRETTVSSRQSKAQTKLKNEQEIAKSLENLSFVNDNKLLLIVTVTVNESYSLCVDVKHPRNVWPSFLKYLQRIMNLAQTGGKKDLQNHIDYRTTFVRDITWVQNYV